MPLRRKEEIRDVLEMKKVAVVGCSRTPGKDAREIPKYLVEHGYEVIPVNPFADEIFGRKAYDSLSEVEEEIDIVNVFRPSDEVAGIVDQALERGDVKVIWTQLGIKDREATDRAEERGIKVVEDRCIKVEHQKLMV